MIARMCARFTTQTGLGTASTATAKLAMALLLVLTSQAATAQDDRQWHALFSLGVQGNAESERPLPNFTQDSTAQLSADLAGLYYATSPQSLVGGVVKGYRQSQTLDTEQWQAMHSLLYAVSGIKFFGPSHRPAAFVRGDLGISQSIFTSASESCVTCVLDEEKSEPSRRGYGTLLGVGYGVPFANASRVMVGVNWSQQVLNDQPSSLIGLSIGGLF